MPSVRIVHPSGSLRISKTGGRRFGVALGAWILLALATACTSDPEGQDVPVLDRETFISTYVELRTVAIRAGVEAILPEQRARVLEHAGVTEEELLEFVGVHGVDPAFMRGVWDDVEERLGALRLEPPRQDTTNGV